MLIPSASISSPYWIQSEPLLENAPQVLPLVQNGGAMPLTQRPVREVGQAELGAFHQSYPSTVRMLPSGSYAQRAVATYESVKSLEPRDGLQTFMGIDDYA